MRVALKSWYLVLVDAKPFMANQNVKDGRFLCALQIFLILPVVCELTATNDSLLFWNWSASITKDIWKHFLWLIYVITRAMFLDSYRQSIGLHIGFVPKHELELVVLMVMENTRLTLCTSIIRMVWVLLKKKLHCGSSVRFWHTAIYFPKSLVSDHSEGLLLKLCMIMQSNPAVLYISQ